MRNAPVPLHRADSQVMENEWRRYSTQYGDDWTVYWDQHTRLPSLIFGGRTRAYGNDPREVARQFISENLALLGLDENNIGANFVEVRDVGIGHRVTFIQQYAGIDVFNGTIHVFVDDSGQVYQISSSVWLLQDVVTQPATVRAGIEADIRTHFSGEDVDFTTGPELVIYPDGAGRLAYLSTVLVGQAQAPWRMLLDANSGEVIESTLLINYADAPDGNQTLGSKPPRPDRGHVNYIPPLVRDANDPCDREWLRYAPPGEVTVTPIETPPDSYYVSITLANSDFGDVEEGTQNEAVYGAGIKLLPCIEYTIRFTFDLYTWDSYNSDNGFWDVFFVHANSSLFYWELVTGNPIAERYCDSAMDTTGAFLPGKLWTFGGVEWGDGVLCSGAGAVEFTYREPDNTKEVYLSFGLDTGRTGSVDGQYPSWGTFEVEIIANTRVFDPNPIATLNQSFNDENNSNAAIPCDAYFEVGLANLDTPAPGAPWLLEGSFVEIQDIEAPANPDYPSRNGLWPYLRSCDQYEAVMAYYHITTNQLYIQSLGFNTINNRRHRVDPHGLDGADNSHYVGSPIGAGYLAFGDGGVDDAEDADVILHEYGHSIQDNQTTGGYFGAGDIGFGNETRAMGEGFGDYWACANHFLGSADPEAFAPWDAQNQQGLRRVDRTKTYPDGMVNQVHSDGEIWSACLWDLFLLTPGNTTDLLVLDHHFGIGPDPTFTIAAKSLLAADENRFGGTNQETIIDVFRDRGIFRILEVRSVPDSMQITVFPADLRSDGDGLSTFERTYAFGDTVQLEAPANPPGRLFRRWIVDGVDQPDDETTVRIAMDHTPPEHLAIAEYITPCVVSPTSLDFGTVNVGDVAFGSFTITNTGDEALSGSVSEDSPQYDITAGGGAYVLDPEESIMVTVRFAPTVRGLHTCIVDTGDDLCTDVFCTGMGEDPPNCVVDPDVLDFGSVTVGNNALRSFTISNTGDGTIAGTVTSPCAEMLIVDGAAYSLTRNQTNEVTVMFVPAAAGPYVCTLDTGDDLCSDVICTGTGVDPPECTVAPTTLDFGTLTVGNTADLNFSITNTGGGTLSGLVAGGTAHYSLVSGGGQYDLTAGQSVTVKVRFLPTASGTHLCVIDTGSDLCSDVSCTGVGEDPTACGVAPTTLDFGSVQIGSTLDMTFTITNTGTAILNGNVTESSSHYSIPLGGGPFTLDPGNSVVVTVRFAPTLGGTHLCIIDTGQDLCSDVSCTGDGFGPPECDVSPDILDFGTVVVGQFSDLDFVVKNTGGDTLSVDISELCSQFSLVGGVGAADLASGDSLVVTVRFQPNTGGLLSCTVETGSGLCSDVTCNGFGSTDPVCQVEPTFILFDTLYVGESLDRDFFVTNLGAGSLEGSVVDTCSQFSVISGSGPFSLPNADTLVVTVRFEPDLVGAYLCGIDLGNGLCDDVICLGVAEELPCLVQPTSIDFGEVEVGSYRDSIFTIENTGS
ncbi:MAG: choice-of-anchor D domain-containing protein, partial [bacterium]